MLLAIGYLAVVLGHAGHTCRGHDCMGLGPLGVIALLLVALQVLVLVPIHWFACRRANLDPRERTVWWIAGTCAVFILPTTLPGVFWDLIL